MLKTEKTTLFIILTLAVLAGRSSSSIETFTFGRCSNLQYLAGSPYQSKLNSLLTSLVNSAMLQPYNNLTVQGSTPQDTITALFQCRGDLSSGDCASCVARAVSQLVGTLCVDSCGGQLQLDGCFVRYDNVSFLGVEDKTVVIKKCGPSGGYNWDDLTTVLGYLESGGGLYRVAESGNVQGVAQCVGDLNVSDCQDCLEDSIGHLKSDCGSALWGDLFLAKCYVRYYVAGSHSRATTSGNADNDYEIQKTLAIIIGLIAGVTVLVVFLSYLGKSCQGGKGSK